MALRISFNSASSVAVRALGRSQDTVAQSSRRLASGHRIGSASDDAAGLAIAERLRNQVRGLTQAARNAQDTVSLVQTAEGGLAETHRLLGRVRELAVMAANDTLTTSDRAIIQSEVSALVAEVDRIATATQFNGTALLNKNTTVSLRGGGSGLGAQVGADQSIAANVLRVVVSAARTRDLGDVTTLSGLDVSIGGGLQTFTADQVTGLTYDGSVDTLFDLRDTINGAGAGFTATVANGRLKLDSGTTSLGLLSDTGSALAALFGSASPVTDRQPAQGSTTVAEIGVGTAGTLTVAINVPAGTGGAPDASTLQEVGITSGGTLRATADVTATAAATDQNTVGEVGSTGGQFRIDIFDASGLNTAPPITVAYSSSETLAAVAARAAGLLNNYEWPAIGGTGDGGVPPVVDFGATTAGAMAIDLRPSSSANTDIFTVTDVTGTLAQRLGIDSSTKATSQLSSGVQTVAQSEYVDVSYAPTDTLEQVRARLQAALRGIDVVASSTRGNLIGATVAVASGTFTVATNNTDATLTITGAPAALGLGTSGTTITGAQLDVQAQSESVTVAYAPVDRLAQVASRLQSSLRAAGAVGFSSTSSVTGATADMDVTNAGMLTIDLLDPAGNAVIGSITDTGGLATALALAPAPIAAAIASTSTVREVRYTLLSNTYASGANSLSSGAGGTLDVSTQTAASAALSLLDAAVTQVSTARASLGAMQARLESASRSLAVATENAAAANSRISDADMAEEMSQLVRAQITQQAGISVLAQANQAPSLVLQLLR